MSLYLTPEQREQGKAEFAAAVGRNLSRRDFMKGLFAAGAAVTAVTPAVYFGYEALKGNPVRVGLIGGGDEGGVLIGNHNPDYTEVVAVADIRPYNKKRIFKGEAPPSPRKGLNFFYGKDAAKNIPVYDDYKDLLKDPKVEAVIIALPLHLHAPVAIDAMRAGKHVLCEKLMAWNVSQCKEMINVAEETNRVLTIGHQRHYSLLYAHAVEVLKAGTLGDIKHIRALWHRNNTWPKLGPDGSPLVDEKTKLPVLRDGWRPDVPKEDREALEGKIRQLGYKSMEELVRWRLYNRTGGGLMAELGSHQLDACSIFLGKVHPLAVSGFGGKIYYHDDREVDDHVFVTFEFPGPNYFKKDDKGNVAREKDGKPVLGDRNDVVVVTYSSINSNSFEKYGECVMGSQATLVVEEEQSVMLFPERNPNVKAVAGKPTSVGVTSAGGGKPASDSSGSTGALAPAAAQALGEKSLGGTLSRGYTEEMEHFAWCIRNFDYENNQPKCRPAVALADAVIALTSNLAIRNGTRIEFRPEWFEIDRDETPEGEAPDVKLERAAAPSGNA
jgi:predicted dehydrogenase